MSNPKIFATPDFALNCGETLAELSLAYETWGALAADGDNAILLLHGYTSNTHAGGAGGWWEGLIGPGRAIDTDRYFVVCPNMPGSSYGSTGPMSIDPETGKPYGSNFPDIATEDMVEAQRLLIDSLGIGQLAAVIGYSYGGTLTFLWGVTHPDRMRALVPVASGIKNRRDPSVVEQLTERFAGLPGWIGGDHYGEDGTQGEGIFEAMVEQRLETLRGYGMAKELFDKTGDKDEAERQLTAIAEDWARRFDPNSLIVLRRAAVRFDAETGAERIKAPVLYVLATTDSLFPPDLGPPTVAKLQGFGVDATYFELDSPYGHRAPAADWQKWAGALNDFLNRHT